MNRIEEKYGLKTAHAMALFIILLLTIAWIVCDFVLFGFNMTPQLWISIIMFVTAAFYALYGYKKPHGNHMRYLCLCQAIFASILLVLNISFQSTYWIVSSLTAIILTTYMAGRLDHYKQNVIISVVVLICKMIIAVSTISAYAKYGLLTVTSFIACLSSVCVWLAVAGGYITRFKLHKEAGLLDK